MAIFTYYFFWKILCQPLGICAILCLSALSWTFFFYIEAGADIGFCRGEGADFQKISKILSTFFRSAKLIFWALLNQYKGTILTKFSAPQSNFRKKNRPKNLGSVGQKWISKNRIKGALLIGMGSISWREGSSNPPPPPPLNPLVYWGSINRRNQCVLK